MPMRAADIMERDVVTIAPDASLADLDRSFLDTGVSGFPVVEAGRLIGVVSRSDVVRKLCTEQSYAEYISEYYRDMSRVGDTDSPEAFTALAARVGTRLDGVRVRDMMAVAPVSVAPSDSLQEVARVMVARDFHRVPVTRDGQLVGIITSLDIVRLAAEAKLVAQR